MPTDRLARYRAKRDFAVTSEPSGSGPPPSAGNRFVVQRHRASRLHYDFRLEAAGVLLSWAVPKGPTLDADVRRMAVQVEDHPLDYYDFEGVIPAGEYGGGDVIVWDWGTWDLDRGDPDQPVEDALAAVDAGDVHFDLHGEKLRGRFVLVRPKRGKAKDWLLLHKHDDDAVTGWDPEDYPRSVKSGRTNDEVKAAPAATWNSDSIWAGPTADELAALDALGASGTWSFGGRDVKLTHLDKQLFAAHTKRDLVRHYATIAPAILPYLAGRGAVLRRFPSGVTHAGYWHRAAPKGAPDWIPRFHHPDAKPGEAQGYAILDSPPALAWAANHNVVEIHPLTSTAAHPHHPTWAMIDIDPGASTSFDDVLVLARLHRTALEHLGVRGMPKVTGKRGIQIWVPVADGTTFARTSEWVEALSRAIGATVPDLISWDWRVADRGGRARLDYSQNAINKTLVAPFAVRPVLDAAVSVPITWDELDDPDLRPDRWNIDDIAERLATAGDPLAPLIGLQQRLPTLDG